MKDTENRSRTSLTEKKTEDLNERQCLFLAIGRSLYTFQIYREFRVGQSNPVQHLCKPMVITRQAHRHLFGSNDATLLRHGAPVWCRAWSCRQESEAIPESRQLLQVCRKRRQSNRLPDRRRLPELLLYRLVQCLRQTSNLSAPKRSNRLHHRFRIHLHHQ